MPLHLLSKKSWNVYNPAAIARVRADEAAAAAREEANEQRLQEYEAAKRLALLRGQKPPAPPSPPRDPDESRKKPREEGFASIDRKKRRRLAGEDDTDRDIRVAREAEEERKDRRDTAPAATTKSKEKDMPLVDHAGHIQLFAPPSTREIKASKDAAANAELKRQVEEKEDRVTMRFSNAAGFGNAPKDVPWYAKSNGRDKYTGTEDIDADEQENISSGKDAFGNEDPGRAKRDASRLSTADPMAVMAKAQMKLKQVERERDARRREREKDLKELAEMQERDSRHTARHKERRSKGRDDDDDDELEGFSLDAGPSADRHCSRERHRSDRRSHGGERPHHRRRHRSRERHSQPRYRDYEHSARY